MKKLLLIALILNLCLCTPAFALDYGDDIFTAVESGVTNGWIGDDSASVANLAPTGSPYNDEGTYSPATTTTAGNVSYGHIEINGLAASTVLWVFIYSSDRSTLLASGSLSVAGGDGEWHVPLGAPYTLVDSTSYNLGYGIEASADYYQARLILGNATYRDESYTVGSPLPSSIDNDATVSPTHHLRLWFTNTSDGS